MRLYPYIAPLVLAPLTFWLWHGDLTAWLVPILWAYIVPAIGTNVLKVWEFDTGAAAVDNQSKALKDLRAKLPGTSLGALANGTAGKSRDGLVADLVTAGNADIDKALANKKITDANEVIARTFKAGNEALMAASVASKDKKTDEAVQKYTEAVTQYDQGLAADPEQPAILTNKAVALKGRGVEKFNATIKNASGDDAARTTSRKRRLQGRCGSCHESRKHD